MSQTHVVWTGFPLWRMCFSYDCEGIMEEALGLLYSADREMFTDPGP